ncbi:hypothetical protein QZH41_015762, partial [Actinostola sp. cb2023]
KNERRDPANPSRDPGFFVDGIPAGISRDPTIPTRSPSSQPGLLDIPAGIPGSHYPSRDPTITSRDPTITSRDPTITSRDSPWAQEVGSQLGSFCHPGRDSWDPAKRAGIPAIPGGIPAQKWDPSWDLFVIPAGIAGIPPKEVGSRQSRVIDCDIMMVNPNVLRDLMAEEKTVIAPMIEVFGNQSGYSNYSVIQWGYLLMICLCVMTRTVIAPMIEVFGNQSGYSNYWGGMDTDGYYKRTDDYFPLLNREITGCFELPMIHSTYLVDLRRNITNHLVFYPPPTGYMGEIDDILIFAYSARSSGIKLHLLNKDIYGYMLPPYEHKENLHAMQILFVNAKLEYFVNHPETLMTVSPHVTVIPSKKDKLDFDEIYMINLKRRPLRRRRMMASLEELGIKVKIVDAVDGKALTNLQIKEMGIKMLPGYADPYSKRLLTLGEIGCFLSHYLIWEEMINNGLKKVLVLEDDIRFQPNFRKRLEDFLVDADNIKSKYNWDFIDHHLHLHDHHLHHHHHLHHLHHHHHHHHCIIIIFFIFMTIIVIIIIIITIMTIIFIIIIIIIMTIIIIFTIFIFMTIIIIITIIIIMTCTFMYDRHPKNPLSFRQLRTHSPIFIYSKEWSSHFEPRNLVAMTAEPLLLYPTHYIGDKGYFSDTETLAFVPDEVVQDKKDEL